MEVEYVETVLYFRNNTITVIPYKPGENILWFWENSRQQTQVNSTAPVKAHLLDSHCLRQHAGS